MSADEVHDPVAEEVKEPTKAEEVAKKIAERFPSASVEVKTNKWGRQRVWVRVPREDYKALMGSSRSSTRRPTTQ